MFNLTTYPNLVGLLECLGVDSQPREMSFALSVDGGALEWGSNALFAQRSNMLSLSFLRMVWDVLRFGREAPKARAAAEHMATLHAVKRGCLHVHNILGGLLALWHTPPALTGQSTTPCIGKCHAWTYALQQTQPPWAS